MEANSEKVGKLKQWIKEQPHLPQKNVDIFVLRFLVSCNYSVQLAKDLIDLFFTMRSRTPDLFTKRQFDDPFVQDSIEIIELFILPNIIRNNQVYFVGLKSDDVDKFHLQAAMKTFTMYDDVQLFTNEAEYEGDIYICDVGNITVKHFPKLSLVLIKKMADYIQEVRPVQLKEVHLVNAPSYIDKLLMILKPFIKAEVLKLITVHSTMDTLHKFVPKEVLPKEYGGTNGSIYEYKKEWDIKTQKSKFIIEDENYWKVIEDKRPGEDPYGEKFGIQGSFRSLVLD